MHKPTYLMICLVLVASGGTAKGDLIGVDTGAPFIADGAADEVTETVTRTGVTVDGVTFDISFDVTGVIEFATGSGDGFIGASTGQIGVSAAGGSTGGAISIGGNGTQSVLINNFATSNVVGGTAEIVTLNAVGLSAATADNDAGDFVINGGPTVLSFDVDGADPGLVNLGITVAGTSTGPNPFAADPANGQDNGGLNLNGSGFDLFTAFGDSITSVSVENVSGGFGLSAVSFTVAVTPDALVPEPTSMALLSLAGIGLLTRRQR